MKYKEFKKAVEDWGRKYGYKKVRRKMLIMCNREEWEYEGD